MRYRLFLPGCEVNLPVLKEAGTRRKQNGVRQAGIVPTLGPVAQVLTLLPEQSGQAFLVPLVEG